MSKKIKRGALDGVPCYYIGDRLVRWARIRVSDRKEKYGTWRVYCDFGWSDLHSFLYPDYHYIQYKYKWMSSLDYAVMGLPMRGLSRLARPYQRYIYRRVYEMALERFPEEANAILDGMDFPELMNSLL